MGTVKHHLKTDHNGDVEHIRTARKDLQKLVKERGDELSADDLAKFLDRHLGGLETHKSNMRQAADTLYDDVKPQGHLVAPLVQGQSYQSFQVIPEKAAGDDDLSKIVPDGVRRVIPAPPTVGERIYGTDGLTMVRRPGQPDPTRPAVAPQFEHLVKVEDDD